MEKLDTKDRKLLLAIDLNARIGTSELGKVMRLSQEGAFYRLQKLENSGVIAGYMTLINFSRLGYTGYGVYARFQNVTQGNKERIMNYLKNHDHVYWVAEFGGEFDIAFAVMAKNIMHFKEIFSGISAKHEKHLRDFTISTRVGLTQFSRKYLAEKDNSAPGPEVLHFGKRIDMVKIDQLDKMILKKISNNPRMSTLELSKKIEQPTSTVRSRIKKLEKSGVIKGYSAHTRCQNFGYQSFQLFIDARNISKKTKTKFFLYCRQHPNIIFYIETVGKWDFEIICEIENQKKFQDFLIDIRTKFQDMINDVKSIAIFDHYVKYDQYPVK